MTFSVSRFLFGKTGGADQTVTGRHVYSDAELKIKNQKIDKTILDRFKEK